MDTISFNPLDVPPEISTGKHCINSTTTWLIVGLLTEAGAAQAIAISMAFRADLVSNSPCNLESTIPSCCSSASRELTHWIMWVLSLVLEIAGRLVIIYLQHNNSKAKDITFLIQPVCYIVSAGQTIKVGYLINIIKHNPFLMRKMIPQVTCNYICYVVETKRKVFTLIIRNWTFFFPNTEE